MEITLDTFMVLPATKNKAVFGPNHKANASNDTTGDLLPISVFIVTKNEEANIGRLLDSLTDFAEVIVVDSGSIDNTVKIAKEKGARVVSHKWMGYSKQKQYAMDLCHHEWVMNLDADEQLPPCIIPKISKAIKDRGTDAVRFLRIDYFMGKPMPNTISLPKNVRLYRKSKARFDGKCLVHESASIKGKTKLIKHAFIHYGYEDLKTFSHKLNTYSSLKAKEKYLRGKRFSPVKLSLVFPFEFVRKYLFQRYALFGWRGVILSVLHANYAFMKEAKLLALHIKRES